MNLLIYSHVLVQKRGPGLWRQKRLVWLISWDFPWTDVIFDSLADPSITALFPYSLILL